MRLIHTKNSFFSIANDLNIKNFLYLSQIFDFKYFLKFIFESMNFIKNTHCDINIINVN